jgi:hypothetical protein
MFALIEGAETDAPSPGHFCGGQKPERRCRAGLILHWKRKSSSDASVKPGSSRLADCHRVLRQEGEWPQDLRKYKTSEEAAAYLLDSVCELDLGGSLGAMQWYSVRLE